MTKGPCHLHYERHCTIAYKGPSGIALRRGLARQARNMVKPRLVGTGFYDESQELKPFERDMIQGHAKATHII